LPNSARQSRQSSYANIFIAKHCAARSTKGLNVIEQWNGANDFVFFARRGELVSNHCEDHEVGMLALHLLQNCRVYINTLMLQQVLAQPHWGRKLTPRDLSVLTPLIGEHVNPYGRFKLDMDARLPLQ
jgi:TnpA family transposase